MLALAWGALQTRAVFLQRGIPDEMPGPTVGAGPRLGVNTAPPADPAAWNAQLDAIAATGIEGVKVTFNYPGRAPFDWAAADRVIAAVEGRDLTLLPLLDGNPADSYAPPANPADYAVWAGDFAARYGESFDAYIIWDEPNLASHWGGESVNAFDYAALLSAAAQAVRAADAGAFIVAAPLAPTIETGPQNVADHLYLQALYEAGAAGAFDVAAGKPYGFDDGPDERAVAADRLNFNRIILLREVMERNGDGEKALWAGNWGWNSLPPGWTGRPSLWGQTDAATQAEQTVEAYWRARREWPWLGWMFLENWQTNAPPDDPRHGFSIAGRPAALALAAVLPDDARAYPGFHLARPDAPEQAYRGEWRFSPEFGADIGASGDRATFEFWGTDVAVRVRRADYRARFYAWIDGRPANALPNDGTGAALVLDAPDPALNYLSTELVATDLAPGPHTLTLIAERGWGQWALNGYSVAYRPPPTLLQQIAPLLLGGALMALAIGLWSGWRSSWLTAGSATIRRSSLWPVATALSAALVALGGWLTWGESAAGVYRRLGDGTQMALTAGAATVFYVAPGFFLFLPALIVLLALVYLRPIWGLAVIAFSMPFYVLPKPLLGYRFSPVEIFILVTFAAVMVRTFASWARRVQKGEAIVSRRWLPADTAVLLFVIVATLSLLFTERLDVATNEWRVVILEPVLFYALLRRQRPSASERWWLVDAFVLGGVTVALYGLGQWITGSDALIAAEGGLQRVPSIYGSPNNLALYLGRVIPLLAIVALPGSAAPASRRRLYTLALVPVGVALLLTFSKGALFIGVPAALLVVGLAWLRREQQPLRPWLLGALAAGAITLLLVTQYPPLAARLNPQGATGLFRLNLWRSSVNMFLDHPWFGVGLDNFLYEYRGRYILPAAWQEPDLNHPHNILLDLATRLGLFGLIAGGWLLAQAAVLARRAWQATTGEARLLVVGSTAAFVNIIAHGLVDHSLFLVDLALVFFLLLGLLATVVEARTKSA